MSESVSNLLDMQLDDLADMPANLVYPDGAHVARISFEEKEINGKRAVELKLVAVETQELVNAEEDTPLTAGDESSVLFMMDNEFGQGAFKEVMKPLGAHLGTGSVAAIFEAVNGAEALIVTKKRWNKEKTQAYTTIKNISLL